MSDNISKETLEIAGWVYESLADDKSRKIFLNKILYSITWDEKYIYSILRDNFAELRDQLARISEQTELIIYGAGVNCEIVLKLCREFGKKAAYICDKDEEKQKKGYGELRVLSPKELIDNHKNAVVIVSTTIYRNEVIQFLREYFQDEAIIPFASQEQIDLFKSQYFDDEIIKLTDGEVFVDGGCYDFETSRILIEKCRPDKIYAFEPDKFNLEKVRNEIQKNKGVDIELLDKGLWNKSETLYFDARGDIESRVVEDGEEKIEVVALDEVIKEKVTFIKMDIEGSELRALKGARNIIQTYRPKLAICIYHKPEDIVDIPAYIKKLVPEYKFYIRHYSYSAAETVLYAVL